jgi:hypothetical protein
MKDRFKPSYERQREIERVNNQLIASMVKIDKRPNQYFNRDCSPGFHKMSSHEQLQRRIVKDNKKLHETLSRARPLVVTREECKEHVSKMEKFSGYFRKFFAIKEAEERAERFAKGKILKSAHFRSQSDLNKNSDRTGYFGKLS